MFQAKYSQQEQRLQQFLEKRVEELSEETGFVQRQRKLSGRVFVQALVLSWLERPSASLTEVRQSFAEMGVVVSELGLSTHALPLSALLQQLEKDFLRFALKQKRDKSPSTLARLLAAHA